MKLTGSGTACRAAKFMIDRLGGGAGSVRAGAQEAGAQQHQEGGQKHR